LSTREILLELIPEQESIWKEYNGYNIFGLEVKTMYKVTSNLICIKGRPGYTLCAEVN